MSIQPCDLVTGLRQADWHTEPFVWGRIDRFTSESVAAQLAMTVPAVGFDPSARIHGSPGHGKPYKLECRLLDQSDDSELGAAWSSLATALRSAEYRDGLAEAVNADLADARLELSIWRYPPGGWLGPHTDKPDKIVTQIFNFNPDWATEWGGCLRILGSESETDVMAEIPPTLNSSIILLRSDISWHMVTPVVVSGRPARNRIVLTAMFRHS